MPMKILATIGMLLAMGPCANAAAAATDFHAGVQNVKMQRLMVIEFQTKMDQITEKMLFVLPKVSHYLTEKKRLPLGSPWFCVLKIQGDMMRVQAGYPVSEPLEGAGNIVPVTIPASLMEVAVHHGSWAKMYLTIQAMEKWIKDNGFTPKFSISTCNILFNDGSTVPEKDYAIRIQMPVSTPAR
jgi:effector-binding domain-containing protein